jgi:hypothetical protein
LLLMGMLRNHTDWLRALRSWKSHVRIWIPAQFNKTENQIYCLLCSSCPIFDSEFYINLVSFSNFGEMENPSIYYFSNLLIWQKSHINDHTVEYMKCQMLESIIFLLTTSYSVLMQRQNHTKRQLGLWSVHTS